MIARNLLWKELKQAKANAVCLLRYSDKQRKKIWTCLSWPELDRLSAFYLLRLTTLEQWWFDHERGIMSDAELMLLIRLTRGAECKMFVRLNATVRHISEEEVEIIDRKVNNYLNSVYFTITAND
ncbi:MAG: hypothetical protein LBL07_03780 [Tannerella sp.]|jgi:hypothetical protein|nr:hypothetical protein [Tannerella sp.]